MKRLLLAVVAWAACGDTPPPEPDAPIDPGNAREPRLTAVRPGEVAAGSGGFRLEADGEIDADAVALFDGTPLVTRVLSATSLEADVPAELIVLPGEHAVQLRHTGADGGLSGVRFVTVVDGVASPILDRLTPDRLIVGSPASELFVDGWNFTPDTVIAWNGAPRATTFLSSIRLKVSIDAADLAAEGTAMVSADAAAPLAFTIDPVPANPIGVLARISSAEGGGDANLDSDGGAVSADGRFVVFASNASNIVANDVNGVRDVFRRDTCRGASGCTPSTTLVSVAADGSPANGASRDAVVSATGRYVAFLSNATNLTGQPDPNGEGVYVRDTCLGAGAGCTPVTLLASVVPSDLAIAFVFAGEAAISADGRIVAFYAFEPTFGEQVYTFDTCFGAAGGCTPHADRVSEADNGAPGSGAEYPALSGTGRFVAFANRTSLDGQPSSNGRRHVYLVDTCLDTPACTRSIVRVTVGLGGAEALGFAVNITMTADARYVGFTSAGTNLTAETTNGLDRQAFLRDMCTGAAGCTPSTIMVSSVGNAAANDDSTGTMVSSTGRFVVFMSKGSDLVPNDTNNSSDVFVRDLCIGAPPGCAIQTRRVSVDAAGVEGNDRSNPVEEFGPWITTDGSLVGFPSRATNLVANDGNGRTDVFVAGTGFP